MASRIDSATKVGGVTLSVADLDRSLACYQHPIGLGLLECNDDTATLGAGGDAAAAVRALPGARLVRRAHADACGRLGDHGRDAHTADAGVSRALSVYPTVFRHHLLKGCGSCRLRGVGDHQWRVRTICIAWRQHAVKLALGSLSACTSHAADLAPAAHFR